MAAKYPLATATWDDQEIEAMQEVIASGMFTMGPKVAEFERQFAEYFGANYAVMSNSGSSANLLMVAAMFFVKENALKAGDEVIVPAVSWSTTYYPLQQYGLKLKFVDVDLQTLNFDLDALESAISEKTRLIMAVNLLGNPNDFNRIDALIADRAIWLIEDNCESMGADINGKKTGTFGAMGTFSTFFSHHISTMEGGLTVTDSEELYHIMLSLRSHGWTRHLPADNCVAKKSDNSFEESFRFVLPGYNLRPLELSGAIGLEQLKKLPGLIAERQKNGALWIEAMRDHPDFIIQTQIGNSSWFGFSLILREDSPWTRTELVEALNSKGFETRPIVAGNFTRNDVMKYMDVAIHGRLANSDRVHECGLFIGNHHYCMRSAIGELSKLKYGLTRQ